MRKAGAGSVRVRIYLDDLNALKIPLPPLEEQLRIVEILVTADKEITIHRDELTALKEQKKGLMQQLLTGKVRVKVN
jgi:type I restriction enzyme S subunit